MLSSLPALAENSDEEIIRNLDFFQNMEIIKDEKLFNSLTAESAENKDLPGEKKPEKQQ